MCNVEQSSIVRITEEAFGLADELIDNLSQENLDEISVEAFNRISNEIFGHVNMRVSQEFQDNNGGDSSENAKREIRICINVARHINESRIFENRTVTFNETSFRFVLT